MTPPTEAISGIKVWRMGWLIISLGAAVTMTASFGALARRGGFELLFDQGPLAINPTLYQQLLILFRRDFITAMQLAVHVGGVGAYLVTAAVVAGRRLDNPVRLLASATLAVLGVSLFAPLGILAEQGPSWMIAVEVLGVFAPGDPRLWRSLTGLALVVFALSFPDGLLRPRWARPLAGAVGLVVAGWILFPGSFLAVDRWPVGMRRAWSLGMPLFLGVCVGIRFFVLSGPDQRRRTRLVVVAWMVMLAAFAILWIARPELGGDAFGLILSTPRMRAIYDVNLLLALTAAVYLFPLAIVISVVRYRLFDIDLIFNRALVFGTIAALGGATFAAVTATLGALIPESVTGLTTGPAGVITGIGLVILFRPLRAVVQRAVDRRFFTDKYEAERAIAAFAARVREASDPDLVVADVETVAAGIVGAQRAELRQNLAILGDSTIELDVLDPDSPLKGLSDQGWAMAVAVASRNDYGSVLLIGPRLNQRRYTALEHRLMEQLASELGPALRLSRLVRRQEEAARQRERVDRELAMARQIQLDLLPKSLPDLPGWELAVHYEPAREVGGDFYDLVEIGDGRWALVVGDVTDKGVPAAMVMATCRTLLRGASRNTGRTPGEVLARVNDLLLPDIPEAMFVTCLFCIFDPAVGEMVMANAGHVPPYLVGDGSVMEIRARGFPLGMLPSTNYEEVSVRLPAGSTLLLSSDGILESHAPSGEMFGFARLLEAVSGPASAALVLSRVLATHRSFVGGGSEPEDDVTLVALGRL